METIEGTTRVIFFHVPGPAVAWHRSGYNRHTGVIFKNKADVEWQNKIKAYAIKCRPKLLPENPVILDVTFYMPKPKYHKADEWYEHIKKPDLDNLVKSVKDALTGSMWKDDCQIIEENSRKFYDPEPRVHIEVKYLAESNFKKSL